MVLNSGHTFGECELSKVNYRLFPRWGDWAVLKLEGAASAERETVVKAGHFDESWKWAGVAAPPAAK